MPRCRSISRNHRPCRPNIGLLLSDRKFLAESLLHAFLEFSGFHDHLNVDKGDIDALVADLNRGTSHYIPMADRRAIEGLLRTIQLHHGECSYFSMRAAARRKLLAPEPSSDPAVGSGASCDSTASTAEESRIVWPTDIGSLADIADSLSQPTIREDVIAYIHKLVRTIVPSGYKITYYFCVSDEENSQKPMTVHLKSTAQAESLMGLITNESLIMQRKGHKNLAPNDLIAVVVTDQQFHIAVEEVLTVHFVQEQLGRCFRRMVTIGG